MNRETLLKILGAMPDEALIKALSANGVHVAGKAGLGDDPVLAGMAGHEDPDNKVKGWSALNLVQGPDDRPKLADKDYIIQKLALRKVGEGIPHDNGMGDYLGG